MAGMLALVLVLQFLVDYLLLFGTGRMLGGASDPVRCALGAAVGVLHGSVCLVPGLEFLGTLVWRFAVLGLMGLMAFGPGREGLRQAAVFMLVQLILGGIALSLRRCGPAVLLIWLLSAWLLRRCFPGEAQPAYLPLEITGSAGSVRLLALRDTGNTLRDPVTGEQVLVISAEAARTLTGLTREQLRHPLETLTGRKTPGLRLIPYRSVGGTGLLLAQRFPEVTLGKRKGSALVAFAPEGFEKEDAVQALTGGTL